MTHGALYTLLISFPASSTYASSSLVLPFGGICSFCPFFFALFIFYLLSFYRLQGEADSLAWGSPQTTSMDGIRAVKITC